MRILLTKGPAFKGEVIKVIRVLGTFAVVLSHNYIPSSNGRFITPSDQYLTDSQAYNLHPAHYQSLIDAGWRRSGSYVYKPDNARTCCPHHTIRLHAPSFQPRRAQRRALNHLREYVRDIGPRKCKGRDNDRWDLEKRWSECEWPKEEQEQGGSQTSEEPAGRDAGAQDSTKAGQSEAVVTESPKKTDKQISKHMLQSRRTAVKRRKLEVSDACSNAETRHSLLKLS